MYRIMLVNFTLHQALNSKMVLVESVDLDAFILRSETCHLNRKLDSILLVVLNQIYFFENVILGLWWKTIANIIRLENYEHNRK